MSCLSGSRLIVLVIGKGAREHALAWKLSQAPSVRHVFVYPGNAGTQDGLANVSNLALAGFTENPVNQATDYEQVAQTAKALNVGLTVIGPDDAVVDGVEEHFRHVAIPCFAPSKAAAELEASKVFAKAFMNKHNIPTAAHRSFNDVEDAIAYVKHVDHRIVIKADGLAAGKGVVLPETTAEALVELRGILQDDKFGAAGSSVVIEEYMEGDEISLLTFSDGATFKSLPPGQDHKRIGEGNTGPNTGGMGVYSPVPFVTCSTLDQIDRDIIGPTFAGLRAEGRPFVGLLFTGIMITPTGPKVIEYNVRFGDPETQSSMMLLSDDTDLAAVLLSCTTKTLDQVRLVTRPGFACNVVVASGGYPGPYAIGKEITIAPHPKDVMIFNAGTKKDDSDGTLRTAGGRVLSIAAFGPTLREAVDKAYRGVQSVHFDGMVFRKDIASQGLRSL
ncbi:phosphoribosylglycinamide synthetase [Dactylonectria macrodidyma]|uniref:phosphoribosylamine--glycine ligase n=1 Tax=Dactylonectria macrodidyma TaxID=307937 RepID=A0A9P9FTI4_9HYPO|nr:phosphoribosylglycinamide synthetase [Dactylonectria macrodidyma]